jgi:hypothetical protein
MKKIIAVIGGSTFDEDTSKYKLARNLGKSLVDYDYRIITGGLSGIMEAAARGGRESENYTEGMILAVTSYYDPSVCNGYSDIILPTGSDSCRNVIISNSDAVVAIGGGAGTLSEIAFAWVLNRMIIAYDLEGWSGKVAGTRIDHRKRVDFEEDKIFKVTSAEEVIKLLNQYLPYYHKRYSSFHGIKEDSPTFNKR